MPPFPCRSQKKVRQPSITRLFPARHTDKISDGYTITADKIAEEIARGTSVILTSNPRNPTGRVVANPELAEIQDICRGRATFISDEFYSGYNYTSNCDGTTISAAENVEDVDEDDVLIIDGLTKRFRLPGWRIAWILGPKGEFSPHQSHLEERHH